MRPERNNRTLLAVALLATVSPLACNRAPASPTRVDVPQGGFGLTAPGGFAKHNPTQPHVVLAMDRHAGGGKADDVLLITVVPMKEPQNPPTLEAQLDAAKTVIAQNHPEATYGPVQKSAVDGSDARVYWLNYRASGKAVRSHRMVTQHDGKVYMLLYTSDAGRTSEADREFDAILSSIKWK